VNNMFNNLEKVRTLFTNTKMNAEKQAYVSACTAVFKSELAQASDGDLPRPASKCFDQLSNWGDEARNRMRLIPDEAQTAIFSNLNEAFGIMAKNASKDEGDPSTIYESEIKEIQRRCPLTSESLKKVNQPIKSMLESAAKKVLDINKK